MFGEGGIKTHYFINLSAQGLGRFLFTGVNMAVYVLVARIFGTEFFGQYSYIIAFVGLASALADFGTTSVLSRDMAQANDGREGGYWGSFLILRLLLNMAVMILGLTAAYFFRRDLFPCLLIVCLFLPFFTSRFFDPLFQIFGRPFFSLYGSAVFSSLYLVLALTVIMTASSLLALVIGYTGANIVYSVVIFVLALTFLKPDFRIDIAAIGRILRNAAPIGISDVFAMVNTRADFFMIAQMRSTSDAGIYNVAYRFLDMAAIVGSTLVGPIIPIFSRGVVTDADATREKFAHIMETICVVMVPVCIAMPYLSRDIICLVFGPDFAEAARVLDILVWVAGLLFLSLFGYAMTVALSMVNYLWWGSALAAGLNVALNYHWIPLYGIVGSAWATLLSEIVLVGITYAYIVNRLGNPFRARPWIMIAVANVSLCLVVKGLSLCGVHNYVSVAGGLIMYASAVIFTKTVRF